MFEQSTYTPANQISQIAELAQTKGFTYDNLDRLTNVSLNNSPNENYGFDAVGNRTTSHLSSSYTHQPFNRLTATDNLEYEYDDNANMTVKTNNDDIQHQYTWDYENRLRSVTTRNVTVEYKYDALGRRVERTVDGQDPIQYTYDGLDTIFDLDTSDMSGTKYINAPGIDNKLSYQQGGNDYYFLADHLGSTKAMTSSNGAVLSSTDYDAFGNATSSLPTRFQYTGREYDNVTGLYYYRARWYDSQIGRFISEDPIGFAGGDVNLYGYVKNKPISRTDPMGLDDADRIYEEHIQSLLNKEECERICNECDIIPNHKPEWDIDKDIRTAEGGPWNPWWYKRQVQTIRQEGGSGPWDYKMQGGFIPNSNPPKRIYDEYGNFVYGATCRGFGFTRYMCLNEAGIAQHPEDDPNPGLGEAGSRWSYLPLVPGGWGDYGDDIEDQNEITRGMDYYDKLLEKRRCGCK